MLIVVVNGSGVVVVAGVPSLFFACVVRADPLINL